MNAETPTSESDHTDGFDPRIEEALSLLITLASGDLTARVVLGDTNDQLDGLLVGLNMLAEELEASTADLRAAKDELEERVRDRTEELREKTQLLESILQNMGDGIVVTDSQGQVILHNAAAAHIIGVSEVGAPIKEWVETYHVLDAEGTGPFHTEQLPMMRALYGESMDQVELLFGGPDRPDGVFAAVTGRPLRDEQGDVHGGIAVLRDITESKRAEVKAVETNRQLAQLATEHERNARNFSLLGEMGNMLQAAVTQEELFDVVSTYSSRLFPNAIGALFMYSPSRDDLESVVTWGGFEPSKEERVFKPDECWGLRRGRVHSLLRGSEGMQCRHIARPDGCDTLCAPVLGQGEIIGLFHLRCIESETLASRRSQRSIEERERVAGSAAEYLGLALANMRLREALREQSIRDPLTNLYNRRYLDATLAREVMRAVRQEASIAVMMLDIDHFKTFNDTYGHDAGDAMLQAFGTFLGQSTRGGDVACRYGGEEFTVIFPDTPIESARLRAEEIRAGVKSVRGRLDGRELGPITVSVGLATYPVHATTADGLLAAADAALYEAKQAGRDCVVVAPTPND
jgi:diguanylate cyclase (GGDEF)-like protein/PAS domain S-box-containing protein